MRAKWPLLPRRAAASGARMPLDRSILAFSGRPTVTHSHRFGPCRFKFVSATQCRLDREGSSQVFVDGKLLTIPAAGVTIGNGGLAASTNYYAYLYEAADGQPTIELS